MKKNNKIFISFALVLIGMFAFGGCANEQESEIKKRIKEYADSIYLVMWGAEADYNIPKKISVTHNEIDNKFESKERKVIFVTDSFTAYNLSNETIEFFKTKLNENFNIFFYDYSGIVAREFASKFDRLIMLKNGQCNFLVKLSGGNEISCNLEFSESKCDQFSKDQIITTVLERMTH